MSSGQPADKNSISPFWKHLSLTRLYFGLVLALGVSRFEIKLTSADVAVGIRAGEP